MVESKAMEDLAERVLFDTIMPDQLAKLGFNYKAGKTFADVLKAKELKPGQAPGCFDRMLANVERNLNEVVVFDSTTVW